MKLLIKITMILILAFFTIAMTGFVNTSTDNKSNTLSTDKSSNGLHSSLSAEKIDMIYTYGTLITVSQQTFSQSMIQFHYINGRYPYDLEELLYSGLCFIWPANPLNNEPLKLVSEKLEPCLADIGKFRYVRESDDLAYFEIVFYDLDDYDDFIIYKFPNPKEAQRITDDYHRREISLNRVVEDNFYSIMFSIYKCAFFRSEHPKLVNAPVSIEEALVGNYYWIKEDMTPGFISDNYESPFFLEWGLAYLDDKPVKFFDITMENFDKQYTDRELDGRLFCQRIISSIGSHALPDVDENWDRMTGKVYYYSTEKLLNGTLNLPESVLISRDEILEL